MATKMKVYLRYFKQYSKVLKVYSRYIQCISDIELYVKVHCMYIADIFKVYYMVY